MNVWHLVLCVVILALAYIFFQYARIRKLPEGTDEMQEMAGIIRDGASTFLKTEFRVIAIVVIVVAAVFSLFVEKTSGITFIMGACMSSVVCILGMRSATYANVRTSNRARETLSIGETVIESGGSADLLLDGTRFLVIDSIETLVACGVFYTLTWYNLQKRLNLQ